VIGAGQAELSATHGLRSAGLEPGAGFVVLDGAKGPGGARQHLWPTLQVDGARRISDLPGGRPHRVTRNCRCPVPHSLP
jgi:cation diffusion facilitator CzcD-associated flavoprotein CzcO